MAQPPPELDLEIAAGFQHAEWRAQRVGWTVWSLVVVAACLGLLGPGWLSRREAASADGSFTVVYDRFLHYHNPARISVTCRAEDLDEELLHISLPQTLLDRVEIRRIEPEPELHQATDDGVTYAFRRQPAADRVKVVFHLEYDQIGSVRGNIALAGSPPVALRQFVYP